jgi:hypothetical protein
VDLAIVEHVDAVDPRAAVGALDLDVHALATPGQFGEGVVSRDVQPLAIDLDARLSGIDLFDQASARSMVTRSWPLASTNAMKSASSFSVRWSF